MGSVRVRCISQSFGQGSQTNGVQEQHGEGWIDDDETRDLQGYIQGRRATGHRETIQVNYNADTETQARQCKYNNVCRHKHGGRYQGRGGRVVAIVRSVVVWHCCMRNVCVSLTTRKLVEYTMSQPCLFIFHCVQSRVFGLIKLIENSVRC